MYEITKKEYLSKTSVLMNVKAPLVAAKGGRRDNLLF